MFNAVLSFNGQRLDPVSGKVHLGNGYRTYDSVLMRFTHPDVWSPFEAGGINSYVYCGGDPVNRADPSGHMSTSGWACWGISLLAGIAGSALSVFTGGTGLPVVIGIATTFATSVLDLVAGLIEDKDPKTAATLGWISLGAGILGGIAEGTVGRLACRGVKGLTPGTALTSSWARRGFSPLLSEAAETHADLPLSGYLPHGFRFLGRSPGYERGGQEMWLDYAFYDYIDGELRLNVASHGDYAGMKTARIRLPASGNNAFTGGQAFAWLHNNNFILEGMNNNSRVSRVRFLMCGGANANARSFAQSFANASRLTTSSWKGEVWIKGALEHRLRAADLEQGRVMSHEDLQARGMTVVGDAMSTGELLQISADYNELIFDPL